MDTPDSKKISEIVDVVKSWIPRRPEAQNLQTCPGISGCQTKAAACATSVTPNSIFLIAGIIVDCVGGFSVLSALRTLFPCLPMFSRVVKKTGIELGFVIIASSNGNKDQLMVI